MRRLLLSTTVLLAVSSHGAFAQNSGTAPVEDLRPSGAEAFTPDNAIMNTAVPFAVGAREAQQSLRTAFGWPTFQEGLVQGVYFRFDPDGYARFSPSPRLDTDVFEVICRPRTYTCMGRKGIIGITLTSDARLQMQVEGTQPNDEYLLNDGFSELQIPPRLNGVLDPQMETLLSGGGSLVVKRNGETVEEISLQGFSAVVAYLKWVAARQDYSVLPRDWPVPNGIPQSETKTGAGAWPTSNTRAAAVFATAPGTSQSASGAMRGSDPAELSALRSEVALLRDLLIAQSGAGQAPVHSMTQPGTQLAAPAMASGFQTMPQPATLATAQPGMMAPAAKVAAAEAVNPILSELEQLRIELGLAPHDAHQDGAGMHAPAQASMETREMANMSAASDPTHPQSQNMLTTASQVRQFAFLVEEMGLDVTTAFEIMQKRSVQLASTEGSSAMRETAFMPQTAMASSLQPVLQIQQVAPTASQPERDYQVLRDYFRSLVLTTR